MATSANSAISLPTLAWSIRSRSRRRRRKTEPAEWVPDEALENEEYELCTVGVIAEVGQRITRPGGHAHVILQGVARGIVVSYLQQEPYLVARVNRHDDPVSDSPDSEAAMTAVLEQVENYISMLPNVPEEVLTMVRSVEEPGWLADLIAFSPEFTADQRQELLEVLEPTSRLRKLSVMIQKRLIVLNLRQQIATEAQAGMDRQQREYFLREQIRAIQKELGEGSPEETLANELRTKIEAAGMPDEVPMPLSRSSRSSASASTGRPRPRLLPRPITSSGASSATAQATTCSSSVRVDRLEQSRIASEPRQLGEGQLGPGGCASGRARRSDAASGTPCRD